MACFGNSKYLVKLSTEDLGGMLDDQGWKGGLGWFGKGLKCYGTSLSFHLQAVENPSSFYA